MHDYYEVLGVPPDADADEIRRAYRRHITEVHPDKPNGDPARARLLDEARSVLLDPAARAKYDAQRFGGDLLDEALDALAEVGERALVRGIERLGATVQAQAQSLLSALRQRAAPMFRAKRRR